MTKGETHNVPEAFLHGIELTPAPRLRYAFPMHFTYRRAAEDEYEILVHHRTAMWRDMGQGLDVIATMESASRTYFRQALADGSFQSWLVEAEGRVIGGGGVLIMPWPGQPSSPLPKRALILNMYVEPEYRRQGIARALMDIMIEWCRAEGLGSVALHASDEGRSLYESLGFRPTTEMRLKL